MAVIDSGFILVSSSNIEGEFTGYNGDQIFELQNGQVWQQSEYKYNYHYAYRPAAALYKKNGNYYIKVDGMADMVRVAQVNIVCEGTITSDFKGFKDQNTLFKFSNGQVWQQAEYKYNYHYAYRPNAKIINGLGGLVLCVEGISETVSVRRAS